MLYCYTNANIKCCFFQVIFVLYGVCIYDQKQKSCSALQIESPSVATMHCLRPLSQEGLQRIKVTNLQVFIVAEFCLNHTMARYLHQLIKNARNDSFIHSQICEDILTKLSILQRLSLSVEGYRLPKRAHFAFSLILK